MKMLNTLFCSGNFEKSLCEDVYDWVHYALTSKTVFVRILNFFYFFIFCAVAQIQSCQLMAGFGVAGHI